MKHDQEILIGSCPTGLKRKPKMDKTMTSGETPLKRNYKKRAPKGKKA